jgi:hypothetical protein
MGSLCIGAPHWAQSSITVWGFSDPNLLPPSSFTGGIPTGGMKAFYDYFCFLSTFMFYPLLKSLSFLTLSWHLLPKETKVTNHHLFWVLGLFLKFLQILSIVSSGLLEADLLFWVPLSLWTTVLSFRQKHYLTFALQPTALWPPVLSDYLTLDCRIETLGSIGSSSSSTTNLHLTMGMSLAHSIT